MYPIKIPLFYFFPAYWGEKEDLSAAISFWSARCGSNLKGDFGRGWAGWQAGARHRSWLVDGGRLAGRRELGGVAV